MYGSLEICERPKTPKNLSLKTIILIKYDYRRYHFLLSTYGYKQSSEYILKLGS